MKTTKEMIAVMSAWNGKWGPECNIQYLIISTKVWENYTKYAPEWNWLSYDYRVDPKTMTPQEKVEVAWNGLSGAKCNIQYQLKTADARKSLWKNFIKNESPIWDWRDFHYRVKSDKP